MQVYTLGFMLVHTKLGTIKRYAVIRAESLYQSRVLSESFFADLGWNPVYHPEMRKDSGYDGEYVNVPNEVES